MNLIKRAWMRIKRRRRISAARSDRTPLREFVYLDEVSVYSLLTSRKGALATEYTDTKQDTLSSELSGTLGSSVGVVKASSASKLATTQSQTTQVLRKSTIQAAFKELREGEEGKLAISPISPSSRVPEVSTWSELEGAAKNLASDAGWIIDPDDLMRGRLFEVVIELEADRVFRVTSIITEMMNIVQENQQLFSGTTYSTMQNVTAISRVLDSLLVGLIPLRCKIVDYRAVYLDGRNLLVHNQLLTQLQDVSSHVLMDVYVAGVTEQRLFWKDVRRVLFSGLQFHAMCRANRNGLQDTWVPVKLFDVLRDVTPDLADQIEEMVNIAFTRQVAVQAPDNDTIHPLKDALINYAMSLADIRGGQLDSDDVEDAAVKALSTQADIKDIEARREAFGVITQFVVATLGGDAVDPMTAAQLRTAAMFDIGFSLDGSTAQKTVASNKPIDRSSPILDTEIVAIYW